MFDPTSPFFFVFLFGAIAGPWALSWFFMVQRPRLHVRRVERRAAAGDPEAMRQMRFLDDLGAAFGAGSAQDAERRRTLRADGRQVRAGIRSVEVGSTRVERGTTAMRWVTMTLRPLDGERERSVTEFVDELYVARLLVGAEVTVFVDRLDPDMATVGWDVV
jgi:hypothetical protein